MVDGEWWMVDGEEKVEEWISTVAINIYRDKFYCLEHNSIHPLSTIHYPLSTIHYPLSTIHHSPFTTPYPLPIPYT